MNGTWLWHSMRLGLLMALVLSGLAQPPVVATEAQFETVQSMPAAGIDSSVIDTDQNRGDGTRIYSPGNHIVRDRDGNLYVVYTLRTTQSGSGWYNYFRRSEDGGTTWSNAVRTEAMPDSSSVQSLAIDEAGTLYQGFTFNVGSFFTKSSDRGATWANPVALHDGGWGAWDYMPSVVVDAQGKLHAVYMSQYGWNSPPSNLFYKHSDDGGATWSTALGLTQHAQGSGDYGVRAPNMYVGKDGWLFAAYVYLHTLSGETYNPAYMLVYYDGEGWSEALQVSTAGQSTIIGGDIAVDSTGLLHMVWQQREEASAGYALLYRTFNPATKTLSAVRTLAPAQENVYNVTMGIYAEDKLVVAYDRHTQTGTSITYHGVYVRTSEDAFAAARQVSTHPNAYAPNLRSSFTFMHHPAHEDLIWVEPNEDPIPGESIVYADISGLPQTATYTVTGTITTNAGNGLAGVTISDGTRIVTSTVDGHYTLGGVPTGSYTLTPTLRGYTFSPPSRVISATTNITGQNFVASALLPPDPEVQPTLVAAVPDAGLNDLPLEILIHGANFAPGATVQLGTTSVSSTLLTTRSLLAVVPAGMTPGGYTVQVTNPDGGTGSLADGYTVMDANADLNDDLFSSSDHLWLDPVTPRMGVPANLGLFVQRTGGKQVLEEVEVLFRRDAIDGPILGRGIVEMLDPRSIESTPPIEVTFDSVGEVTIFAIIDPDNKVAEHNEENNVVQRTLLVAPAGADRIPPVVQRILINGGTQALVTNPEISVGIHALDPTSPPPSSGMSHVSMIEYIYSDGIKRWVPLERSGWLPYEQTPSNYDWTLRPLAGMRYIQVRARDAAGNISIGNARRLVNYEPASDTIARDQTRVYRYSLEAGQAFEVNLEVLEGDADLYVWSSQADQSARVSNLSGSADERVFIAASDVISGLYQVEVYGYTAATYRLATNVAANSASVASLATGGLAEEKDVPTVPVVPVDSIPSEHMGSVPNFVLEEEQHGHSVYLPLVRR